MIIKNKTPFGEDGCYYELIANPEDKVPFKGNGLLPKDAVVGSKMYFGNFEFIYTVFGETETWSHVLDFETMAHSLGQPIPIGVSMEEYTGSSTGEEKLKIKIGTPSSDVAAIANGLSLTVSQIYSGGFCDTYSGVDLTFGSRPFGEVKAGTNYDILYVKINNKTPQGKICNEADVAFLASIGQVWFRDGCCCVWTTPSFFVPFEGTEDGYEPEPVDPNEPEDPSLS